MTDLSIIIVSYKGWDKLIACLNSLNEFRGDNFSTEVIVVDNNSRDERIFEIQKQYPRFRFIFNKINGGFAYGCNTGADKATGDYLLFLNPDTVATERETAKLLDIKRNNPSCTILSCRQVNAKGKESRVAGRFPAFYNLTGIMRAVFKKRLTDEIHGNNGPVKENITFAEWISGSVVMIKKTAFEAVSGFDEDFWMYFEDVDLCKRVRDKKGEVALAGNVVIEHNHGGSSRINIRTSSLTKTEVHISRHVYISKHKKGAERFFIQAFLVINNLISSGIVALAGIILFFVPKVFSRTIIFARLICYYLGAAYLRSWISPRSVNRVLR